MISGATLITAAILLITILCLLILHLWTYIFILHRKSTQKNVFYGSCCGIDGGIYAHLQNFIFLRESEESEKVFFPDWAVLYLHFACSNFVFAYY